MQAKTPVALRLVVLVDGTVGQASVVEGEMRWKLKSAGRTVLPVENTASIAGTMVAPVEEEAGQTSSVVETAGLELCFAVDVGMLVVVVGKVVI